jgi:hypothetical protein
MSQYLSYMLQYQKEVCRCSLLEPLQTTIIFIMPKASLRSKVLVVCGMGVT